MTGLVFGVALLVSSTGVSPATEPGRTAVVPTAFNFNVPYDPGMLREPSVSRRAAQQPAQPKRFSKTDRFIALAAGGVVGFLAGGIIGGHITETSNPDDDISPLKGIVIGAPIGGALGAVAGYWLTNR